MEILFYHLELAPLDKVLPMLLEKSLERGWKVAVELGRSDNLKAIDDLLWTWREDGFLPHAAAGGEHDAEQPVLLTTGQDNPNGAHVRFFVEGAVPRAKESYERLVYMFDGHDPDAVTAAREAWKALREGNDVTYWQQDPNGRWAKKG